MPARKLVLAFTLLACSTGWAQTSKELNTQGFRLYNQHKYPEALELFKKAMEADDASALAHYNYAATLGVLRKQRKVCAFDAYKTTILDHLEKSVKLDPKRATRVKGDHDFDEVRDTVRYQKLVGRSLENPAQGQQVLEAV